VFSQKSLYSPLMSMAFSETFFLEVGDGLGASATRVMAPDQGVDEMGGADNRRGNCRPSW
jgi:hypothetical protein